MSRRRLSVLALLAVATVGGAHTASAAAANGTKNGATRSIAAENAQPGTTSWFIDTPRQDEISGYFDDVSYLPGQLATLYADSHGDPFSYTVYRMGYYQGLGGREIASGDVPSNPVQPDPIVTGDHAGGAKLLTTGWKSSTIIPLGANWVSGFYLVKLHDDINGGESYANFVLRATTPAPIVINLSTNTWQAYNRWGNLSLYRDSRVTPEITKETAVAHQVTFLRPYLDGWGAGMFFRYDRPLVEWAEMHGYPVSYSTDEDIRNAREAGPQTKLVIFSGHEEYYSMADRNEVESLTGRGVSEAFFGGNAWAWQARFNDRTHVMSVWRTTWLDPAKSPKTKTVRWESVGLPQDALTGTMQTWGTQKGQQSAYATSSWPWNGAGVVSGQDLGPLEGDEWDGIAMNPALPPGILMLSRTPFSGMPNIPANQAMTIWQKTRSAFVFAAGQTTFNWNLSYPGVTPATWVDPTRYPASSQVKPAIERLVGNLLERATGIPNPIEPIAPTASAAPFALLGPQPDQYVKAAPGPMVVDWSDPPAGTATIQVYGGNTLLATVGPERNVAVVPAFSTTGPHMIRVVAATSDRAVLATLSEQVSVLAPNDGAFRENVNGISRVWGNDDDDPPPVRACFRVVGA